ncbi:type II toxin-antitoxin system RelE/ParE family toxin [Chrysiogenes arsenatis]|uniref:type II toxin-antitoxin system RelE/ParE family toxin n=1 Tax=Chrysiogenes arsenatis TaxID=309797 RepID=UPI000485B20C|nr:type II toxin-antitoxin system RelE/ParE family toxin [Chrysiogenes arsenatis]
MIKNIACSETAKIFSRARSRKLPQEIQQRAYAKLVQLDSAIKIDDLRLPPSNKLEALKGDLGGYWSIRINNQWRICFQWNGSDAENVQIMDYH